MFRPHHIGNFATEHPKHQHIKKKMPEIHMHEHVGYKAPRLFRGERPERTKVGNIFSNAAITEARQIQVQPENLATDESQCKNDRVTNQQHPKDFR